MYPNPYMMNMVPKTGLLTRSIAAIKSIKWGSLLEGTQKTLGVINQAIPIVYQVRPLLSNARTLFRVASAINSNDDMEEESNTINNSNYESNTNYENEKDSIGPKFFL